MSEQHRHLDPAAIVERLRATPLFGGLDDDSLRRLATQGQIRDLAPGETLIREGELADALFVVLEGEMEVTKRAGRAEIPLARVGPGSLQGELAALEGGRRLASVRAATDAEVLQIPVETIRELLAAGPDVALAIIHTAVQRLRSMEGTLREREKLAGLGTLAAGLAHELNNPAAAISRSVAGLEASVAARTRAAAALSSDSPRLARLVASTPAGGPVSLDAITRSDRVDEIAAVLTSLGAADPGAAAGTLADAGWEVGELREALEPYGRVEIDAAVAWLTSVAGAEALLGEVRMASGRISEIVGAVKSYAYLDQAPVQRIDVVRSLEDTLVILRHKLKEGVSVRREYADDLSEIEGYGSELNQVWTNIIDNAIDAMQGRGELLVRAEPCRPPYRRATVTICDAGPGIPAAVLPRLFEPFFTTKPPGVGTGLGLHISHSVVARHGGRIEVSSEPGRTCFVITLPETLPPQ